MLCKKCDVFVGYGAVGVAVEPSDVPKEKRDGICWVCRRPIAEIQAAGELANNNGVRIPPEGAPALGEPSFVKRAWDAESDEVKRSFASPDIGLGNPLEGEEPHPDGAGGLSKELTRYADKAMFTAEEIPDDMPRVYLLSATPDPLGALAAASKMYKGEVVRDLRDVTDEEREHFWEEVAKTHLKAPLEFIDFHFMVEGVTRAFTHQMVRQRTAVYAQESMRFAVKEKIAARPGPLIESNDAAKMVWENAMDDLWSAYLAMIANGIPAEEARGLLPHDTLTRLHFKTNLRNLADHLGNRLCTQAQFEWRLVAAQLCKAIRYYTPPGRMEHDGRMQRPQAWQFERIANSDIFRPVCFEKGHCPFNAEFDRGCTIRERVERGEWDLIETAEWLADPTAGWVR